VGTNDFTRKDCIRALRRLDFWCNRGRRGRHDKFIPPQYILESLASSAPRFIMVPRHSQIHCQREIIQELRAMGGEELVRAFTDLL